MEPDNIIWHVGPKSPCRSRGGRRTSALTSRCDPLCCFLPDQRQRRRLDTGLHAQPDQHDSGRGPGLAPAVPRRLRLRGDANGDPALRAARHQPALPLLPPLQGAADRLTEGGVREEVTVILHGR